MELYNFQGQMEGSRAAENKKSIVKRYANALTEVFPCYTQAFILESCMLYDCTSL